MSNRQSTFAITFFVVIIAVLGYMLSRSIATTRDAEAKAALHEKKEDVAKKEAEAWRKLAEENSQQANIWKTKYDESFKKEQDAIKQTKFWQDRYANIHLIHYGTDAQRDSVLSELYKN